MKGLINIGMIWTVLAGTAGGMVYVSNAYVSTVQFKQFAVEIYYDQYYEVEDRIRRALEEEDFERARELGRRLERLRAKICDVEPQWVRCSESS